MSNTIVITGGSGFVGQHLITHLKHTKPHVPLVIWDRTLPTSSSVVQSHEVDLTNPASYREALRATQPAWIVHLAAFSAVGESWKEAETVQRINVTATKQLLKSIQEVSPATRFFAVSSADIYGLSAESGAPLPELALSQAQPHNPYGQSKWDMEHIIENEFNDQCLRVRPFPHIGPGQRVGFVTADFASQIAASEAGQQPPIMKVGNLDAVRDFTDVRDVVRAYALLLDKGVLGEVYHVATGHGVGIKDILNKLLALSSVKITVETDPDRLRPSEIPTLVGDATKLRQATGWEPEISLDRSLQDILDYWRSKVEAKS